MTIRFLFINAIDPTNETQTSLPPLGIGYLISSMRQRFGEDTIEFKVADSNIHQTIMAFNPHIVGISAVSQNYRRAQIYAKTAQSHGCPVIIGGFHISMLPESLTIDMDVGVIGEGEAAICDLFQAFLEDGGFKPDTLRAIPGIVYREFGKPVLTEPRRQIEDIDTIPRPARDVFKHQDHTYMFTSRGCPFKCAFCSSSRFWDGVRQFSPEYVVAEIAELVDSGVKMIHLFDDLFPLNYGRVMEIADELEFEGLSGKVKFGCAIRANMVDDYSIAALKRLGVISIGMGLESGNDRVLRYLKGRGASVRQNAKAIKTIRRHGIAVSGTFIIGSPDETHEEIMDTYRFIRRSGLSSFHVYPLTPLPGTPIWGYALEKGIVSEDMAWERLDVDRRHGGQPSADVSENFTFQDILQYLDRFERLKRRKAIYLLGRNAIRQPSKVPGYLWRRMKPMLEWVETDAAEDMTERQKHEFREAYLDRDDVL